MRVGPCGKWLMVIAVGVPLFCVRSDSVDALGDDIPVLVEQNHIAESFSLSRRHKIRENQVSTVQPNAGWEQEPHLLGEGHQF